jgi:Amt family ammonium transporter
MTFPLLAFVIAVLLALSMVSAGVASGAVTGLVVITSASGFVDHTGSFVMGLLGAPLCYVCVFLKNKFGLDQKPNTCNRIDAFGVHAIGGMMGSLMLVRPVCF